MFYIHFEEAVTFVLNKKRIYFLQYVYEEEIELKYLGSSTHKEANPESIKI